MDFERFRPGDLIGGKYRVVRVLGEGGMGTVVEARQETLGQQVALKILHEHVSKNADMRARFMLEAKVASQLDSEHIVRVHDLGEGPGPAYIAMDLLHGDTFEQLLEKRGPLPVREAVQLVTQACKGVAIAHKASLVHRDIKPANLFLARKSDGSEIVKILDFGLIKDVTGQTRLTTTAVSFGSPSYMSPEQIMSAKHVDARTDQHALAVTLFEMLSFRLPYEADTPTAVTVMIATQEPGHLPTYRPDVPEALWCAIKKALEKSPADRYEDVGDFALAVADAVDCPEARRAAEATSRILHGPNPRIDVKHETLRPGRKRATSSGTVPMVPAIPQDTPSSRSVKATHSAFASGSVPPHVGSRRAGWIGAGVVTGLAACVAVYFGFVRAPATTTATPGASTLIATAPTADAPQQPEAPQAAAEPIAIAPEAAPTATATSSAGRDRAPVRVTGTSRPVVSASVPVTTAQPAGAEFVPGYKTNPQKPNEFVPGYDKK